MAKINPTCSFAIQCSTGAMRAKRITTKFNERTSGHRVQCSKASVDPYSSIKPFKLNG